MPTTKKSEASPSGSPITRETFRFFRDLARNNRTEWMQANRDRYKESLVLPLRQLCERLTPAVTKLNAGFDCSGRTGANFSRINRDIRFAKDKTPYKSQMYLTFSVPFEGGESGQLYAGFTAEMVTAGYRIYVGAKRKESELAMIAEPRIERNPKWIARLKARLGRKYESYWYSTEKGEWTKHKGWPPADNWKKVNAWIVRRKLGTSAATKPQFTRELEKVFRELYPLLKFTSLRD